MRRRLVILSTTSIALIALIVAVRVGMFWYYIRQPAFPRCDRSMRQLGLALTLYADEHQKHLPDTLEELLLVEEFELSPEIYICPSSPDEKAPGQTAQERIANIRTAGLPTNIDDKDAHPRHCSYIYAGRGLTINHVTPQTILLYEPLANHNGDGINILFGDGHVEFVQRDQARRLISSLPHTNATINATSSPATRP